MSKSRPTLVFVAGPQAGQRAVLTGPTAILGRGASVDVMLSEDFVSRRQAKYELLRAGPTLENLSSRGTWINGKRFTAGKKVLLETGDVIGAGAETEILFVAAGDDPDAALAMHDSATPRRTAFGKKHLLAKQASMAQPKPVAEEPPEPESEPETFAVQSFGAPPAEEQATPERAKRRKIMIGLGIYMGAIFVVIMVILVTRKGGPASRPTPKMLSEMEIEQALAEPIDKDPDLIQMANKLQEAKELYQQYGRRDEHLHECVKAFKESLAYSGRGYFDNPEDQDKYDAVLTRLTEVVKERYRDAYIYEEKKDWRQASAMFDYLMRTIGDPQSPVFKNVLLHYERVKYYDQQSKKKGRGSPLR